MVNLNWEELRAVNVDEIGDEEASHIYEQLIDVDADAESNLDNLKLLFRVTQAVMQAKAVQAEVALEELEQMARKSSSPSKLGSGRTEELEQEVERLKEQLGDGDRSAHDVEMQNEKLRADLQEKDRKLAYEARETERHLQQIEELKSSRRELETEMSYLKEELDECKRQLSSQSFSDQHVVNKEQDYAQKMREKNKEISKLLEELESAEVGSARLRDQVISLRDKLAESTKQMDMTTADYIVLKNELQQSESVIGALRQENQTLRMQVADLVEQNQARIAADDEIIATVNARVEEWKAVLSMKEALIIKLQSEVKQQQESLTISSAGFKGNTVNILSKAIDERDQQIAKLKHQLQEATLYMEENTSVIQKLKEETLNNSNDWQLTQLQSLQTRLAQAETRDLELKARLEEAESHALEKDKELTEALVKLSQYEQGEYGLAEAVQEIKDYKLQLRLRDKQIEDSTRLLNQTELALGELKEENGELYQRIGLSPKKLDYEEVQNRVSQKHQKEKALNEVLQKEVERLEEERLVLKKEIRKLAQIVGLRASKHGLTVSDAKLLQDYAESRSNKTAMQAKVADVGGHGMEMLADMMELMKRLQNDVKITQEAISEVKSSAPPPGQLVQVLQRSQENELLALLQEFKSYCGSLAPEAQISTLRMALLNAQSGSGDADVKFSPASNSMTESDRDKATLEGSLAQAEEEIRNLIGSLEESNNKVLQLQSELNDVKVQREKCDFYEDVDALAQINSHILRYIKKVEENGNVGIDTPLLSIDTKQTCEERKMATDYQKLLHEKESLSTANSEKDVKLNECEKLIETLVKSDNLDKNAVAELNRKLTRYKVNDRILTNKYSLMEEENEHLRKEAERLQNEMVAMEGATLHRLNYLTLFKEMATFKIASLLRALDDSVPSMQYKALTYNYNELMKKHQQLLDRDSLLYKMTSQNVAEEQSRGHERIEVFDQQLRPVLEKLNTLESLTTQLPNTGSEEDSGLAKKVALLEIKSINEHQRADHAVSVIEEYKNTISKLEKRNRDLEENVVQLTELVSEQQRIEQELQANLEGCSSKDEYDRISKCAEELEAKNIILRKEIIRLKEVSEIASRQVSTVENRYSDKLKETQLFEKYFQEFQNGTDDKVLIGSLYRQLIKAQMNEEAAKRKLESCQSQLQKIEALSLRLEKRCDEKEEELYRFRNESRLKVNRLHQIIQNVRCKLKGAVPLSKYEAFMIALMDVRQSKLKLEQELECASKQNCIAEEKMAECEEKSKILEEVIAAIRKGSSAEKLLEWQSKMVTLNIQERKSTRRIEKLTHEIDNKQEFIRKQDETIASLEQKITELETQNDEHLLIWENREQELERTLSRLENEKFRLTQNIDEQSPDVSVLENPKETPPKISLDSFASRENLWQYDELEKKAKCMEKRIQELETIIDAQNKVIAELQPKPESPDADAGQNQSVALSDLSPALKVAKAMVESLQARLSQKEETIVKYQDLLQKAREDFEEMRQGNLKETEVIRSKLQNQTANALVQFRDELRNFANVNTATCALQQCSKMKELQDIALQQDAAIALLTDKLKASSKEIQQWQLKVEATTKELLQEKDRLKEEYEARLEKLEHEIEICKTETQNKEVQLTDVRLELEKQIEVAKKSPSSLLKATVEQFKGQLHVKDRQIQALSNALEELKREMKSDIDERFSSRPLESHEQSDVMLLLQQQSALQEQLNAATYENEQLKKRLMAGSSVSREVMKIKEELESQMLTCAELKREKHHLEKLILDLEAKIARLTRAEDRDTLEANVLRSKIQNLEEKLAKHHVPEKPYDSQKEEPITGKPSPAVETWQEIKKWQQLASKLKSSLAVKETEHINLEKSLTTAKGIILRLENEKVALEKKIKQLQISKDVTPPANNAESFLQLYRSASALQEEVSHLKRQLFVDKDLKVEELKKKNHFLSDQVTELTAKLQNSSPCASPRKVSSTLVSELNKLQEKEKVLQEEVLQLLQENLKLKFEVEQGLIQLPQYVDRIGHLEKYVDVLKAEATASKGEPPSPKQQKSKVGPSGRVELERIVDVLKKVIEKLQRENQQIRNSLQEGKKARTIVEEENSKLKEHLGILTSNIDTSKSQVLYEKQISKIVAHNERLLGDLQKEVNANEALRVRVHDCKAELERLRQHGEDLEKQVEQCRSQHPSLSSLGGEKWKSQAVAQLYEDKLAAAEKEVQQQKQVVDALKNLLREAIEMEDEYRKVRRHPLKAAKAQSSIRSRFQQLCERKSK